MFAACLSARYRCAAWNRCTFHQSRVPSLREKHHLQAKTAQLPWKRQARNIYSGFLVMKRYGVCVLSWSDQLDFELMPCVDFYLCVFVVFSLEEELARSVGAGNGNESSKCYFIREIHTSAVLQQTFLQLSKEKTRSLIGQNRQVKFVPDE